MHDMGWQFARRHLNIYLVFNVQQNDEPRRKDLKVSWYVEIFADHVVPYARFVHQNFGLMHENIRQYMAHTVQQ